MAINKKIRVFFWLINGLLKKYFRLIILSLVLGGLGFLIVTFLTPFLQKMFVPRKIGLVGHYNLVNLPDEIINRLSTGLTALDEQGQAYAYLTDDWQVSDDGKTYTFQLKDNLFWQNGDPLEATEINFDLEDVSVETKNNQITFRLKEPFSPFPVLLAQPIFKQGLLGIGPYKVLRVQQNGQLLEAITLKSENDSLTFKFYPTEETAKTALKLGEINELKTFYSCDMDESWQTYLDINRQLATDQFVALFFNLNDPNLADKNLRQALAYATPKPQDSSRALGPISPASWAYNPQVKRYDFNPDSANDLLAKFQEAGEEEASESSKPSLDLTISTVPMFLDLAEDIKQKWQDSLDITIHIKTINSLNEDFQVLLVAQEIPPDPDQYSLWHSTQTTNITGLNSPKIDKLLEDGRKVANQKERKEIYLDFQRFLLEESPAVFLSHPYECTFLRK